ncbi:AAA family ATPase [Lipingzhangella sp. LS1_29]|uniref:AAA family ATPase n=1 Tax=Lipingzhangella rawalii TaxID=2055835 RepID=A0ABU2H908_9ACTN|nr:AAA family ATPase [Lipingzhangella rawalii]MDS1271795.1 AAA family ATPase [Lipingzhangella rawalii]
MLVQGVDIPDGLLSLDRDQWPYTVPAVHDILTDGLELRRPVTFLVGENGSGKSTIVEAIAEAYGLDARGGRAGRKYANDRPKTPLGEALRLDLTVDGARQMRAGRRHKQGYFLRAETTFGFAEVVSGMHGYWEENLTEHSHGEGFLIILNAMFDRPGLYLMDEPEAALSFMSCLRLVNLMHELGENGSQIICATHSPILAATPGADIIEVGGHGARHTTWDRLELVDHWRRYLANPDKYLRHLIDP